MNERTYTRQDVDDIIAPWLKLCKEQSDELTTLRAENEAVQGRNEDLEAVFEDIPMETPLPRPPECRHNRVEKLLQERKRYIAKNIALEAELTKLRTKQ